MWEYIVMGLAIAIDTAAIVYNVLWYFRRNKK